MCVCVHVTVKLVYLHLDLSLPPTASDYIPVREILVFNASTTRRCFNTSALKDSVLEVLESYRLRLSFTQTLNTSLCYDNANITIIDYRSKSAFIIKNLWY